MLRSNGCGILEISKTIMPLCHFTHKCGCGRQRIFLCELENSKSQEFRWSTKLFSPTFYDRLSVSFARFFGNGDALL